MGQWSLKKKKNKQKDCKQKCWRLQLPQFIDLREFSTYWAWRGNRDELGRLNEMRRLNWDSRESKTVKVHRRVLQRGDSRTARTLNIYTGSQLSFQLISACIWGNHPLRKLWHSGSFEATNNSFTLHRAKEKLHVSSIFDTRTGVDTVPIPMS